VNWLPLNLAAPEFAKLAVPPAICELIYRGKRHIVSGVPEALKTLLAAIVALTAIRQGIRVAWIDFETGPCGLRRMFEDIGATLEEIGSIHYVEPAGPPDDDDIAAIADECCGLAIIDAAAGAFDVSGLDDNKRQDVEKFANAWITPLWKRGVGTVLVDHVTKNADNRGRFTIGSEARSAALTSTSASSESDISAEAATAWSSSASTRTGRDSSLDRTRPSSYSSPNPTRTGSAGSSALPAPGLMGGCRRR